MYKITNKSTTYIAVENVNLAPGKSTTVAVITESLHYLENKGAIKLESIKLELPKPEPPLKVNPVFVFKPVMKPKKEKA